MIKSIPLESIKEAHFGYITAITKPQIESLIKQGVVQLDLFDESLGEVEHEGIRYVFRRNPIRVRELEESRQERTEKARGLARKLSEELAMSKRKRPAVALRKVQEKIVKLKIDGYVSARLDDRIIVVDADAKALSEKARLDGVYMLKTDVKANKLAKESIHRVYKSLYAVETDFRTMKTDLEVRPIYVRKKSRTRGHVLMVMLALILRRELEKMLKPLDMEVSHAIAVMDGWTLLNESLGELKFNRLPQPSSRQQKILDAVGMKQPTTLCVPRKKGRRKTE
jgi:transposase